MISALYKFTLYCYYYYYHKHKPQSHFAQLWLGIVYAARQADVCETEAIKWHATGIYP